MRRALLALVTTVVGLVVLLDVEVTPLPSPLAAGAATPVPGATTATGTSVATGYGPVQVQIAVSDEELVAVTPISLPAEDPRSVELSSRAAPLLAQEAISAQSADVDMVSGATYTSRGYAESLQSALDQVPALTPTGQGS